MSATNQCFQFSEEQEHFRRGVRELAQREIVPHSARWERDEKLPWEGIQKMAQMNLLGILAPRELGGQQRDYTTAGIAVEELARADASCAIICSMQNTLTTFISGWGEENIRSVLRGEKLFALATTEPGAGSDITAIKTIAEPRGDHYVINGAKRYISLVPGAAIAAVSAKVPTEGERLRINLFRVETNLPGVKITPIKQMGLRAHQMGNILLTDVRVPATHLMGEKDEGLKVVYARWNVSRALGALTAAGIAESAIDATLDYVKQRQAYGQPIGKFEAVQFALAESQTNIEAAKLLAYRALWLQDRGVAATKEAAMAKWFSVTVSYQAINYALQFHGAAGYTQELNLEQKLRDSRGLFFTGGTVEIMKMLIAREMLGKKLLPYR